MSRSVAPRSAPGGDWAQAAGSEGCSGVCVGNYEGIMNGASAKAFLPNFVGFPSLRGLHSSTVQAGGAPLAHTCAFTPPTPSTFLNAPQRPSTLLDTRPALLTRRRAPAGGEPRHTAKRPPGEESRRTLVVPDGPDTVPRPELSCPVSAASAASAPTAPAPAGRRPASAGRTATARRTPRRTAGAPARARTRAAGPPAVPGPARTPPAAARRGGHESNDDQYDEHRQDDAYDHGATLLPFPRSGPPWALLLASASVCVSVCSSCCFPVCASCVKGGCPRASRTKAELSNSRG
ncbi:hypothetical protein QF035_005743 [Streptomyces umbrinus]|uniref:Uncharacterized protein n=1 Tax=Streptomyces umbrinus TaxID=67370 RepID=A0ABU0SX76_9ACTN|nr:hypothetical protein [Streptomyces umbrinus]